MYIVVQWNCPGDAVTFDGQTLSVDPVSCTDVFRYKPNSPPTIHFFNMYLYISLCTTIIICYAS